TATLTFEGALAGRVDGPTVTCPAPGEESDAYATWRWRGTVDDRPVTVMVAALRSATYPDVLMIESGGDAWGGTPRTSASDPSPGYFEARIDADGTLHIDGSAIGFAPSTVARTPGTVYIKGALRCPKK
ncbi:MAG TPA: hypothetical protein VK524_27520, partial [Polyangiaceae bacterium]|nr:hypothetical protein [Polyangiaceae bacterium]